jgi:SSS family transporter
MKISINPFYIVLFLLMLSVFVNAESMTQKKYLEWSNLPDLPDKLGRAGAFIGVHENALIIAGGANFPEPVWESQKRWHDGIYVLTRDSGSESGYRWHTGFKLPRPIAYGASVSTGQGLVCIGGNDAEQAYSDVFLLSWNPQTQNIVTRPLPSVPLPCAHSAAARIGSVIYVAGGISGTGLETAMSNFWSLDLSKMHNSETFQWQMLPSCPGGPRAFNLAADQFNGQADCIYVMSGRRTADGQKDKVEFLTDVYEFNPLQYNPQLYDPQTDVYSGPTSPWRQRRDLPRCAMAGTSLKVGQGHIFVIGGADETLWGRENELKDNHPGFSRRLLIYHTITDTWIESDSAEANQVTTTAVRWGNDSIKDPIIIASGEVRPRVRTPHIWSLSLTEANIKKFGWIDFSTLVLYFLLMLAIGVFFAYRNKNTDDFFRGGQQINWFVAGLSIFATMLSSITFVAVPAKAFMTDWVYIIINVCAVILVPFVIWFFLPFFRRINATSAYEYLEKRFNRCVRLFASASFILFQVGRMAVVTYLPALALSAITPMTEIQCILLMGVLSIIYCTLGGLEAVVWTDAIQTFVLLGAALVTIVVIMCRLDGGAIGFFSIASEEQKFLMVNWDFSSKSFMTTALWVMILGGIGQQLIPYTSDMAIVQRYMSVPSIKQARRAIWTNAIAVIPSTLLFFGVGTCLYVFYKQNPQHLDPIFKNDAIFPLFISRELPVGVSGLVIAGIFAAAQSTISSSMNSTSTAFVTDFMRPFDLLKTEKGYLTAARVVTFISGMLGTVLAVWLALADVKSLWDIFLEILGLLGGSMCGLFCLGIFTKRANGPGAIIGAICGAIGLYFVQEHTTVHFLLYAAIGVGLCVAVGYAASLCFRTDSNSVRGLTIHTIDKSH